MDGASEVLSVGQLYRKSKNALAREFRGPVWVAGEIKSIREQRGNWYIALVEPGDFNDGSDITLDVACWSKKRLLIQAQLASAGVVLAAGMEVRVRGNVTLGKFGKLQIELSALDIEGLLGRAQAEKRLLFDALVKEGLAEQNRGLVVPLVPLRIGLVTSEGSDGYKDFLGEIERSPFAFAVSFAHSQVQGPTAPALLARSISSFAPNEVDVIAVVRGGGGELDAFDKEPVVRAIASAPVPVWAGVGHTADRSLADEIANQSFITPTACAQALVAQVAAYVGRVAVASVHVSRTVRAQLDLAESRLHRQAEGARRCTDRDLALATAATTTFRNDLRRSLVEVPDRSRSHLSLLTKTLHATTQRQITGAQSGVAARAGRLKASATHQLERWTSDQQLRTVGVKQFDPVLAVKRGYTLTHDSSGRLVRSLAQLAPGEAIATTLADGVVSSTVTEMIHLQVDR